MQHRKHMATQLLPLGAALMAGGLSFNTLAQDAILPAEETVLSTVKVEANADNEKDGYRAGKTRVGKILQDPHDIPQAVTTITNQLMEDQQVGSLREALRNVSGLTFNAAEGGRSGDNMMLRGFYTFGDMYLDGIRDTAQYNRETFNDEQIDVLRGSAAMLFGRGQAGGVINQVSKTPLLGDHYKLTGSMGTTGYLEQTADLNKELTENVAVRINLMNRDEGSWRSNPASGAEPELHRRGVAISVGVNLYTDNQFWLNHYYLRTHDNPDYGISFDTNTREPSTRFSSSTFWGIDRTFDNSDTHITTLVNEFRLAPDSQIRTQIRYADYDRSYWAKTPNLTTAPDALGVTGGNATRAADYETWTLQSDFSKKFTGFGMKHELLAGVEYLHEDSHRKALFNFGGTSTANPPEFRQYEEARTGNSTDFKGDSYAFYAQDTVEFIPKWKATLGARRDEMNATYSSTTSPTLKFGEFSYRAALSFHPAEESHFYLSWSDSFSPTADLYQLTVQPQPAERSQATELGVKWLLFNGDLALRAALYRAEKQWERNTDLESTASILTKRRRTDGLELEAAGRINDRWEVFSGLALMDSRILDVAENINATTGAITLGNSGYTGQRARNTPPFTFNLWTTYKFGAGWKVGGGVEAKGDRYGFNPSSAAAVPTLPGSSEYHPNTAPAYARWDAMAAYEQKRWTARLNIKNVFDELYYDAIYDNGSFVVPGTRRAAIMTLELKF